MNIPVMRRLFATLLILFAVTVLYGTENQPVSLSKVTPDGGVSYTSVMCIVEDELGFIWFGTNNGLYSYNTAGINRYSHIPNDTTSIPTNRINQLFTDFNGKLWIATENGLCTYNRNTDNFTTFHPLDQFGNIAGREIKSLFQVPDGAYWIADERGIATFHFDSNTVVYKNVNSKTENVSRIATDGKGTVWAFFSDGEIYYKPDGSDTFFFFAKGISQGVRTAMINPGNIWVGYETKGILCFNTDGSVKHHYNSSQTGQLSLPNDQIRSIINAGNNQIWAATYDGIAIIEDFEVISVVQSDKYPELPNHSVWSLYCDSRQNIWIGTWLGGLCFHSEYNNSFFHYTQSMPVNGLSYAVVSSIIQEPLDEKIIIGTEDGVLNYFNPLENVFTRIPVASREIASKSIKTLAYGSDGTLWIGTYGQGVFYQTSPGAEFRQLKLPFQSGIQALNICATDEGVWVSNYPLGVYFYHFKTGTFQNYQHNPLDINTISDPNVHRILQDRKGNMWFATRNGLNLLEKGSDHFVHYFHQENNPRSISTNTIYTLHEDKQGFLWLGTNGKGLDKFDPETGNCEHFTTDNGLPGNEVLSIAEDRQNRLWLATVQGLCVLDPETGTVRSFTSGNGIQNNSFNPNSAFASSRGELYFGGTNGFIRFFPERIMTNPRPPKVVITHFYIHNKEIVPDNDKSPLKDVIAKTRSLTLKYNQNSFSFRFVSDNFINPAKNSFKFRLSGLSETWTDTEPNERANFTNIPPGKYVFEVLGANNDGVWGETPAQIYITIVPPVWARWYALLIYALLAVLIMLYFRRQVINRQKLKNEIELEKVNRENEEYLHQMKLQFFTNISHEFRTPLTLIQGPVTRLIRESNEPALKQLQLIKNNSDRLIRLVNQFLDFRKIDSGKLVLNPVNAEIVSFCQNIFSCFQDYARQRAFDFHFEAKVAALKIDFDPDKLDKIIFNILSNAFKYSPDGGRIRMTVDVGRRFEAGSYDHVHSIGEPLAGDYVAISIADSGKGISAENLSRIFERFYQVENNTQLGTGIGLALTRSYVLLHGGQLMVSTSESKGSVFTVYIPRVQPGTMKEVSDGGQVVASQAATDDQSVQVARKESDNEINNPDALVLVVEDNLELLNYLGEILQSHFRIARAKNGREAADLIHSLFPDLIVSDIMMPDIDGIQLCQMVKDDIRTSHIPFILLTALATVQDRISGLQSGADAYLSKPFDDELLIAQINNLLESRKILRETFGSDQKSWEERFSSFDLDKRLILKAIKVVEENMTDVDFSVEDMASRLNLSRTHLHRKLKSLTNQSATEFIRSVRLKHAVKLIQEGNHKINEIGYAVGFNSHTYFTKSFKKQFGKSPSDMIREQTDQNS
jgi:signal transduction histidine kinase/ligand-binding sensor domain-containing protein/DNA-binding response OmpR family regulator